MEELEKADLRPSVRNLGLGRGWIQQRDNDPKHQKQIHERMISKNFNAWKILI